MQTEESGSEDAVDDLEVIAALISSLIELIPLLPQEKKRRKRIRKLIYRITNAGAGWIGPNGYANWARQISTDITE